MAPILGFAPLHLPWIFGVPLLAHAGSFDAWYHGRGNGTKGFPDGILGMSAGAFYLTVLTLLADLVSR